MNELEAEAEADAQIILEAMKLIKDVPMLQFDVEVEGHVIVLPSAKGPVYPAYQFNEDGILRDDIAQINFVLGADIYPLEAAVFWQEHHPDLEVSPMSCIDVIPFETLMELAKDYVAG